MIVADTNLVAYLFLAGHRTPEARRVLRRDPEWVAPPLWQSEFRNVLVLHVRKELIARTEVPATWARARALVRAEEPDAVRVVDVALDRGLSAYDAEFVALAEALAVRVVTDDGRVLAACPDVAVSITDFAGAQKTWLWPHFSLSRIVVK